MRAIRLKCLDCCCGSASEVRKCHISDCSLHPYRFGKRPSADAGVISDFRGYDPKTMAPRPFTGRSNGKKDQAA